MDLLASLPDPRIETVIGPIDCSAKCKADAVSNISFVDDTMFPFLHKSPQQVLDWAKVASPIIFNIFAKHALKLNFKRGKIEIVFALEERVQRSSTKKCMDLKIQH